MIKVKRLSKTPSFKVNQAITLGFRKSGKEITDNIKKELSTGARSGRLYIIRGMAHKASAPGQYPAKLSGKLVNSQNYRVANKTLLFGNSAHYAAYLENGTRKMDARTFLKPLVEQKTDDIEKNLDHEIQKVFK
ncbi:HK97-gp10 family putative phage morphogenesis protein [Neisseria sp. Ec49-e6-T10]|uniref:HK97-gp10 family putative phage morphogenesis protein n=1 Tax=Neisseria sp. Ec49-e6-T10 TaxID=3140744 RepID=UPI003EBF8AFF